MRDRQPYQAFVEDDYEAIANFGKREVTEFILAIHAGMSTEEFNRAASAWLRNARHPSSAAVSSIASISRRLELLDYLRANHFKTFIVSGGGLRFIRAFAEGSTASRPSR